MVNVNTNGIAKGAASPTQYADAGYRAGMNMVRLIVTILLIVLICVIVWKIWEAVNAAADAAGTITEQKFVQGSTGITPTRQTQIRGIAMDAHKAIWGKKRSAWNPFSWFGSDFDAWTEDETAFVTALNRLLTAAEVSLFNDYYREIGGHSAKSDMDYLSASQQASIKLVVSQNLN